MAVLIEGLKSAFAWVRSGRSGTPVRPGGPQDVGALEAVDGILARTDSGAMSAGEAIEQLLDAQFRLRNNRRLQAGGRLSRLPAVKTLAQFDFQSQLHGGSSAS